MRSFSQAKVAALDRNNEAIIEAFRRVIEIKDTDYHARKFHFPAVFRGRNLKAALRAFRA